MSRRSLALLAISVVALGLGTTSCGGGKSASDDAVRIVKAFYADVNASEIDKAMDYVAGKAVFINPT